MVTNLEKVKLITPDTPEEVNLFDESGGYEDDRGVQIAAGLSEQEHKQAVTLYRLFNELWGLIVVVGDPGAGKDTFGNYLSYTIKRFFPNKRILRDERPRKLFGEYAGLFNEDTLVEDLKKLQAAAKGAGATRIDQVMEKAADEWAKTKGVVMLKDSVVYLTELWKYCYNREPHKPMNKTMGGIFKIKRHLNALVIGTIQAPGELDKRTCLKWVDWRVTCTRSRKDTTLYTFLVEKVKYDYRLADSTGNEVVFVPMSRPYPIPVDAGKPRSFMGDGKITILKPEYIPETDEERIVLNTLKGGIDKYEDMAAWLDESMSEWEVLTTLKRLALKLPGERPKFVIDYPCYYHLFNSKSDVGINTSLKGGG